LLLLLLIAKHLPRFVRPSLPRRIVAASGLVPPQEALKQLLAAGADLFAQQVPILCCARRLNFHLLIEQTSIVVDVAGASLHQCFITRRVLKSSNRLVFASKVCVGIPLNTNRSF
jgi:hypothetical protein